MTAADDARLRELSDNLDAVRRRIDAACAAAGRRTDEVTLVAVSKTWPSSDVLALHSLGVTDFGESYDQEASAKASSLAAMGCRPRWHFVGRLQRNKCASIARYADVVHAVDRVEIIEALVAGAARAGRDLDVLLQLSLDGNPDRGGVVAAELPALADRVEAAEHLRLRGLMALAPLGAAPAESFAAVEGTAAALRTRYPGLQDISAGMTGDLEAAIANGSTCVRVGTAVFGLRAHALD
ncbi:MAG: YggS family pyridoxal phosphate-dependent enzyme [Mycobacteriales bacterium]